MADSVSGPICPRCKGFGCKPGDRSNTPKGYCPDCRGSGRLPITIGSSDEVLTQMANTLDAARHALVSSGADAPATLAEIDYALNRYHALCHAVQPEESEAP